MQYVGVTGKRKSEIKDNKKLKEGYRKRAIDTCGGNPPYICPKQQPCLLNATANCLDARVQ